MTITEAATDGAVITDSEIVRRIVTSFVRAFYERLVADGYSEERALEMTSRYVRGVALGTQAWPKPPKP